jgi:hypothetical protein
MELVAGHEAVPEQEKLEQLSDVWDIFPEYPEYKMCYCADPWGNVVELHSRGYEHMHANLAEDDPPAR